MTATRSAADVGLDSLQGDQVGGVVLRGGGSCEDESSVAGQVVEDAAVGGEAVDRGAAGEPPDGNVGQPPRPLVGSGAFGGRESHPRLMSVGERE